MKFLVTGANGFVGRALCAEFHERGFAVRAALRSANLLVEQGSFLVAGANGFVGRLLCAELLTRWMSVRADWFNKLRDA